jgi:hypothetical protein
VIGQKRPERNGHISWRAFSLFSDSNHHRHYPIIIISSIINPNTLVGNKPNANNYIDMLLGKEPEFAKRLGPIWQSTVPIQDLATLKKHITSSTLIAFDLEGHVAQINEIGLASLSISEVKKLQPLATEDGGLRRYYDENEVQAHTIIIWEEREKRKQEAIKYGGHVTVHKEEVGKTLLELLSTIGPDSDLTLVGYDMYSEFDWISRECPSFLSRFKHWVDVQEIVEECCGSRPSLLNTLAAMKIIDRDPTKSHGHRAANDAVRTLAVLSNLVSFGSFDYQQDTRTKLFSTSPRHWRNFPFKARITTRDNSILPPCIKTPRALATLFKAYSPTAVLIDSRTAAVRGVRVWWVCVPSECTLDALAAGVDGSILDGQELAIEKVIPSWINGQIRQQQDLENDEISEQHVARDEATEYFSNSMDLLFSSGGLTSGGSSKLSEPSSKVDGD